MIIGFKRHLPKTDLDSINVYMRDDVHVLISIFLAFICPRVIVFFFFTTHTHTHTTSHSLLSSFFSGILGKLEYIYIDAKFTNLLTNAT